MHNHIGYTGHGVGTVTELVEAACKEHITRLAITEHYSLSKAFDPDALVSMPENSLNAYCAEVLQARDSYSDIDILLGCEMDWLGAREDRKISRTDLACFDVVLGSVHFIDGWAFDDPTKRECWETEGADCIWRRYFEVWCEAVLSDKLFTVMAHPDLCKKFGHRPSFNPQSLYRQAAEAAHEAGCMIELNTSGAWYPCEEMYPAPALLSEFRRAGVPCTLGTDAHRPEHVARGLEQGIRLMYESGYREITVPTRNKDRCAITIE